jgi:hypothetical protein
MTTFTRTGTASTVADIVWWRYSPAMAMIPSDRTKRYARPIPAVYAVRITAGSEASGPPVPSLSASSPTVADCRRPSRIEVTTTPISRPHHSRVVRSLSSSA